MRYDFILIQSSEKTIVYEQIKIQSNRKKKKEAKYVQRLFTCLAQLVKRSKFKKTGHTMRRGVSGSSPNKDS